MINKKVVYLIILDIGIGGVEKRFAELWIQIQKQGYSNIKLVLPKELLDDLSNDSQLVEIKKYMENIIFIDWTEGGYFYKRKILIDFMKRFYTVDAVYHFVLLFPIFSSYLKKYKTIYTYPSTDFGAMNFKGRIVSYLSFLESKKIDILDPQITSNLQKIIPWKKKNIQNTPGSFVNTNYYYSVNIEEKKNWLVFLGRFESKKQVFKFVKSIPLIDKSLKMEGINDHHFFILGFGTLEKKLKNYLKENIDFINISYSMYFEKEPINILKYSKIFFSLQRPTNYPSKSLLEAISCGNIPIVTDNRDTRLIANESFSYYVPEKFSSTDLAQACVQVLKMDKNEYRKKIEKEKDFIKNNFSVQKNINYFFNLYKG